MRRSTTSEWRHTITRKIQRWRPPESSPQERHTAYGIPQRLQMLHLARGARYTVTGVSCSGSSGVVMTVLRPAHIIWYHEIVPLSKWRCKLSICCTTIEKSIPLHDTDSWFARMKTRCQSCLVLSWWVAKSSRAKRASLSVLMLDNSSSWITNLAISLGTNLENLKSRCKHCHAGGICMPIIMQAAFACPSLCRRHLHACGKHPFHFESHNKDHITKGVASSIQFVVLTQQHNLLTFWLHQLDFDGRACNSFSGTTCKRRVLAESNLPCSRYKCWSYKWCFPYLHGILCY